MSTFLFANNAATTLAGPLSQTATTCNVAAGSGVLFPQPGAGQFFAMTFLDAQTRTVREIVYVTAVTGDTLTITRAQENTAAATWNTGDIAANLITAGALQAFAQSANLASSFFVGTDSGSDPNNIVVGTTTPINNIPSAGQVFLITKNSQVNTGGMTLRIPAGGTSASVVYADGSSLVAGDWPGGATALVEFTGGVYQMLALLVRHAAMTTYYGVLSGTNATTTTLTPAVASMSAIPDGSLVILNPSAASTGNVTVNGTSVFYVDGSSNLLPGELQASQPVVTVKLGSSLLLRSPPNPQRTAILSSTATPAGIPANQYTPAGFATASSVFASISGTTITILQPGNYNLTAQLTLSIAPSSGSAGNYAFSLQVRKNGSTTPIFGGEQDVGNYGTGSQTASPSVSPTTPLVAGDTLQVLGFTSATFFQSGAVGGGNFSLLKVS